MRTKQLFGPPQESIDHLQNLTESQRPVAESLLEYLTDNYEGYDYVVLSGFAGTGKSYTLNSVIAQLDRKLACSAPTHKAVKVLARNDKDQVADYGTIHSFLGLKQVINNVTGEVTYAPEGNKPPKLNNYSLLLVDEASMLDTKLFKLLMDYKLTRPRLRLIFSGDSLQIPPVGEPQTFVFLPTDAYKVLNLELTQIMRQAKDNPILRLATDIRENIDSTSVFPSEEDFQILRDEASLKEVFKTYYLDPAYERNADFCKVLTWTNDCTSKMNGIIRDLVLKFPVSPIMPEEKMVFRKPYVIEETILFKNSDEVIVEDITVFDRTMAYYLNGKEHIAIIKCFNATMINEWDEIIHNVYILHPDDSAKYNAIFTKLKTQAIKSRSGRDWRNYYNWEGSFAWVKYNYATTTHLAQGSSYEHAIVMHSDICNNKNITERNRIRYVAVTRAKNNLIFKI